MRCMSVEAPPVGAEGMLEAVVVVWDGCARKVANDGRGAGVGADGAVLLFVGCVLEKVVVVVAVREADVLTVLFVL